MAQPEEELVLQPRDLRRGPEPELGTLADVPMVAPGALVAPEPVIVAPTVIDVTESATGAEPAEGVLDGLKEEAMIVRPSEIRDGHLNADLCGTQHRLKGWKKSPGEMTTTELDDRIVTSVKACGGYVEKFNKEVRDTLYPALLAMEKRFDKQQGARSDLKALKVETWHEYLQSRQVNPATFRSWKSRNAVQEMAVHLFPPPSPKKPKKVSSSEVGDTEQKLLAKAGLRLAKANLDPLLTADERTQRCQELSEQLVQAAEGGVYEVSLPEPQALPVALFQRGDFKGLAEAWKQVMGEFTDEVASTPELARSYFDEMFDFFRVHVGLILHGGEKLFCAAINFKDFVLIQGHTEKEARKIAEEVAQGYLWQQKPVIGVNSPRSVTSVEVVEHPVHVFEFVQHRKGKWTHTTSHLPFQRGNPETMAWERNGGKLYPDNKRTPVAADSERDAPKKPMATVEVAPIDVNEA